MARTESPGPFRADHLRPGDRYELSNGHLVPCLPAGAREGRAASVGGDVLASDPAVQDVGLDVGFSPSPEILRAPDIAVGGIPDQPGWVHGVPLLAVEYADIGQNEEDLQIKIRELISAGTRYFWVVRLTGTPRVETHQAGEDVRTLHPGEQLTAPGVLANPVPVEALYDREAARRVIFSNLLQREGYASPEEVRAEGEIQSLRDSVLAVLTARSLAVEDELRISLARVQDPASLRIALRLAATTTASGEIITALREETPA